MHARTALVIEEESGLCQLFSEVLELEGIEVNAYASPETYYQANGERWCRRDPCPCYDFMLIDKRMRNMSGLGFLRTLEEAGCQLNSQRKAIISGDWGIEDLEAARKGGYKVLEKPCPIDAIIDWVEQADNQPKTV